MMMWCLLAWRAWLLQAWWWQQRRIDLAILWPACKRAAQRQTQCPQWLDIAKAAFARHCFHDQAWLAIGEPAIYDTIDALT